MRSRQGAAASRPWESRRRARVGVAPAAKSQRLRCVAERGGVLLNSGYFEVVNDRTPHLDGSRRLCATGRRCNGDLTA